MRITLTRDGKFISEENTGKKEFDDTAAIRFLAAIMKDPKEVEELEKLNALNNNYKNEMTK